LNILEVIINIFRFDAVYLLSFSDSPDCIERLDMNYRKCLLYFLCTKFQNYEGFLEYEASVTAWDTATTHKPASLNTVTANKPAFDFSGLIRQVPSGNFEV
jgi:hypothetical protein